MILSVSNIKGGVGKSTLACSIACALSQDNKNSVLLIDGDKQGSASLFGQSRAETQEQASFTCVRAVGREVRDQVISMRDKFDHIILDTGGQDSEAMRAGLVCSDAVLVPVAPRSFETWALEEMANAVKDAQSINFDLKAYAVLNLAYAQGSENNITLEVIAEDYPIFKVLGVPIVQRKTWADGMGQGLCPLEMPRKDPKACDEFTKLLDGLGAL